MSKIKKVATDGNTSTFQHEDGHQIKVYHGALSPIQKKQIEKMPVHLEGGGDSEGNAPNMPSPIPLPPPNQPGVPALPYTSYGVPQYAQDNQAPEEPAPTPAPTANDNQAPVNPKDPSMDIQTGYQNAYKALGDSANTEAKLAKEKLGVVKSKVGEEKELYDNMKKNRTAFDTAHQEAYKAIQNGTINPNHWMESPDRSHVAMAIGTFLGGLGSAFTGQPNPALEIINRQIDRDIDAQKANLGKQKTLLEANQAHYHDQILGDQATRAQLNDYAASQIEQQALKEGTPIAMQRAALAKYDFQQKNEGIMQSMVNRASLLQQMHETKPGQLLEMDPAQVVTGLGVAPEKQKAILEEIKYRQNLSDVAPKILDSYDKAAHNNHLADAVPGMHSADQKAFLGLINTTIAEQEGTAKAAAFKSIEDNMLPARTDSPYQKAEKRKLVENYLRSKESSPAASSEHIDLNKFRSTNIEHGVTKPQIQSVNGVQYQKVPGGWKKLQ